MTDDINCLLVAYNETIIYNNETHYGSLTLIMVLSRRICKNITYSIQCSVIVYGIN